jgi:phage N-6-adenine-methyltransferase
MSSARDCWETPPDFWGAVDGRFEFELDVCATAENSKCPHFISPEQDALKTLWSYVDCRYYRTFWCNPGFSNLMPWMKRAHDAAQRGGTAVVLSHASHTAQWARFAMQHATELWLPYPRIQFIAPVGVKQTSNTRDSMLWIFTPWGNHGKALIRDWAWKEEIQ